jgi:dolichyl-phosphate-mannose-protein mannosyltransferase
MTATEPTKISINLTLNPKWLSIGFTALVILISYFTYFNNYAYPQSGYWDESYHIASAQKYLNGIFFMEPHPPLGKILLALGEKIIHANPTNNDYIGTDFAKDIPASFSFAGYRFFPVLLSWLTAPLIFWIFLLIAKNHFFALFLSSFYLFDNALIVHLRGAMLEGILLFFLALTILMCLLSLKCLDHPKWLFTCALGFGIAFGLLATTKVTGYIALLLLPLVPVKLWTDWKQALRYLGISFAGFAVVFITVWQLHFAIASQINPALAHEGYYDASPAYQQILKDGRTRSPLAFPAMLADSLNYTRLYNSNVPKLDLCHKDEGGSPSFLWPLGARSINYRWETPDGSVYRYLYLQINPVIWALALLGIICSGSLLLGSVFLGISLENGLVMGTFMLMYVGYMLVMSQIGRVMYLYHYFPPLLFSFFLFGLSLVEIKKLGKWDFTGTAKTSFLAVATVCVVVSYSFFSPLTYNQLITDQDFHKRMIFPLWQLRCVNCEMQPILVLTEPQSSSSASSSEVAVEAAPS